MVVIEFVYCLPLKMSLVLGSLQMAVSYFLVNTVIKSKKLRKYKTDVYFSAYY
jgi:hypothetical protein